MRFLPSTERSVAIGSRPDLVRAEIEKADACLPRLLCVGGRKTDEEGESERQTECASLMQYDLSAPDLGPLASATLVKPNAISLELRYPAA